MIIMPKKKLLRRAIPLVLCAPLILPITAFKPNIIKKEPLDQFAMFMPLMATPHAGKYGTFPTSGYKGKLSKTTNTTAGTTITFSSVDIGTAHDQRVGVFAWNFYEGGGQQTKITVGGTDLDYTSPNSTFQNIAGENTSCVIGYLALGTSYGATTTITHTPTVEDQACFQLVYWILYPPTLYPNYLGWTSSENNTTGAAVTSSMATQPGGLATLVGCTGITSPSALTTVLTAGTGTVTKNVEEIAGRTIAAWTVTCDGSAITASMTRDLGGSAWKAIMGYTWARPF